MRSSRLTRRSFGGTLLSLSVLGSGALNARAASDTLKVVTIFQGRRIAIPLPPGWTASDSIDRKTGVQTVKVGDPRNEVELQVSFFPDTADRFRDKAAVEAFLRQAYGFMVAGSVEHELKLVPLARGDGASARFTDASLVNRKPPPGEWLCATAGLRYWHGAFLMFTLLSSSYDGPADSTAFDLAATRIRELGNT